MKALGGQEKKKRLVTIKVELPEDIDGILDKIREILVKGEVQNISIRTGEPITYQRYVQEGEEIPEIDSTASFANLTLGEIIRNIEMEEFDLEDQGMSNSPSSSIFLYMMLFLELGDWVPVYLLLSHNTRFWPWMGIPKGMGRKLLKFVGLKIERDPTLPDNVFLICCAKHRGAAITEVTFVLKGNVENERTVCKADRGRSDSKASNPVNEIVAQPAGRLAGRREDSADGGGVTEDGHGDRDHHGEERRDVGNEGDGSGSR